MDLFIHHEASPYVRKALLVCDELALHPKEYRVDITSSDAMDDYRKLNPTGKFPTLRDGELVIWESNAILIYLAQCSSDRNLACTNRKALARVTQWLFWELAHFAAVVHPLVNLRMGFVSQSSVSEVELLEEFHGLCCLLDEQLKKQCFILGGRPSLPDFAVASDLTYANDAALPLADYSQLNKWFASIRSRSSWRITEDRKNHALASER